MDTDEPNWQSLVAGLREGDSHVAQAFYEGYVPLLQELAERHLARPMLRRVGPDDIAQSACRTFFRRAQGGQFQLEDRDGLWRLLSAITLAKVREQSRFHLRKKRGLAQEQDVDAQADSEGRRFEAPEQGPGPDAAAEFAEQFERLINALDPKERQLVDLKLQQCTSSEAAERLGCSERTVRRLLKRIQSELARQLGVAPE